MRFHRSISLLRSRNAAAMASTAATTFWWGRAMSVAPQHPAHAGHGARCAAAVRAARSELERARWGMEHGAGWGSRAARDGMRGGEDGSSERMTQQHVIGESDREIFLRER